MKSFFLQSPERERRRRQQQRDEEEGAALVLLVPPGDDDDDHGGGGGGGAAADHEDRPAAAKQQQLDDDDDDDQAGEDERQQAATIIQQQAAAWWVRRPQTKQLVVPARGVGLVIAGLVVLALVVGSTSSWWIHLDYASSFLLGGSGGGVMQHQRRPPHHVPSPAADLVPIPFSCGGNATTTTTSSSTSPSPSPSSSPPQAAVDQHHHHQCPEYFRFIHSDLSPWRATGITREAVERGRGRAAFRLVVVGGRAFVETYHRVFQTRDTFTQWGIAQLLARYPGRVPDLDLMFNCEDMPEVRAADFPVRSDAPPLFRYCKDDATLDIVFPDWSFWGWPEVNIRPWAPLLEEMAAEMARLPWPEREPYAYWKGNPGVSADRADLLRCNVSDKADWNARVFAQDWGAAIRAGFRGSNLAEQCRHRYKVFVRGRSWSVSEKYILACDSPVLLARRMGGEGSGFAREELAMDYVYDYMLHLLTEYARLLRYKPTVPEQAVELRAEALACPAQGRDFMMESRERYVADYEPCTLPPPFTAGELRDMARRDREVRDKVKRMTSMEHPQP
ncbi:hypothetical protein C2845_PM13G00160 [Panicum miliaceum]|uniref:Glycosyl transferase CAP10 domain-containing protein n=1 Tax=Panicum miliaceum TaxID=4540 RepID=A0A3L6RHB4_PANMI|nr:hypothetical protein C2845_PM13G00160 [Panicum miliaceum]